MVNFIDKFNLNLLNLDLVYGYIIVKFSPSKMTLRDLKPPLGKLA